MKRLIISLVAGLAGVVALLAGLGIDAWFHAEDETLAAREGIFTLANPGHALLALGIAMACGGIFSALHAAWGMAGGGGRFAHASVRHAALGGSVVASVGAIVFALAVSSSGHADDASHPHVDAAVASVEGTVASAAGVGDMPIAAVMSPETDAHVDDVNADEAHADTAVGSASAGGGVAPLSGPTISGASGETMDAAHTHIGDSILPGDSAMTDDATLDGSATMSAPAASHPHEGAQATTTETACMAQLTEDTRAATARFSDYDVALAEGYVQNPGKVGANHYPNRAYRLDGKIMELSQPETLIYKSDDAGNRTLVGVMFTAARGLPGPTPCGSATQWHTHLNCIDPVTKAQADTTAPGICPDGYNLRESGEMIHVWFVGPGQRRSA